LTRYDKILFTLVGLIILVSWAAFRLPSVTRDITATVQVGSNLVARFPLRSQETGETYYHRIDFDAGQAVIEERDGKIRMMPMPKDICPLGICSHTNWIDRPGQTIVCMPNRIVISLQGGQTPEVDAVSY